MGLHYAERRQPLRQPMQVFHASSIYIYTRDYCIYIQEKAFLNWRHSRGTDSTRVCIVIYSNFCSWEKDKNLFHSFCYEIYIYMLIQSYSTVSKAFVSTTVYSEQSSVVFFFTIIHFICIQILNNCRRKFSKIPLDSTWKYATRCRNERNKLLWTSEKTIIILCYNLFSFGKFTLFVYKS